MADTPCIYDRLKVHKEGIPFRPAISNINSVTYNMAKHLAPILTLLVGRPEHPVETSL